MRLRYVCTYVSSHSLRSFLSSSCGVVCYVLHSLLSCVSCVLQSPEIHRGALWILGEYASSVEDISRVMQVVKSAIGEVSNTSQLRAKRMLHIKVAYSLLTANEYSLPFASICVF